MTERETDVESYLRHARRVPAAPVEVRSRVDKRMEASLATMPLRRITNPRSVAVRALTRAPLVIGAVCLALLYGVIGGHRNGDLSNSVLARAKSMKPPAPPASGAASISAYPDLRTSPLGPVSSPRVVARGAQRNTAPPATSHSLGQERELLSRARSALARGMMDVADNALAEHASRYRRGALTEEREALRVHALAMRRDIDGAEARLRRFERQFPASVFTPTLHEALNRHRDAPAQ